MSVQNFFLEVLRIFASNKLATTGSTLSIIGAIALTSWVDKAVAHYLGLKIEPTETWIGLLLLGIGVALLVYNAWRPSPPNPHDVELYRRFRNLTSTPLRDFLRNHNFYNNFGVHETDPLDDVADQWKGAKYEFTEYYLNKPFQDLLGKIRQFCAKLELKVFHEGNIATVRKPADRIALTTETKKTIDELNNDARQIMDGIDDFGRKAKRRILSV